MSSADPPDHEPKRTSGDPEDAEPRAPRVGLHRTDLPDTADVPLWAVIRNSTDALSFHEYERVVDGLLGRSHEREQSRGEALRLPFQDIEPYRLLRGATELFMALPTESRDAPTENVAELGEHVVTENLARPHLVELIWSYWLEQGLLAETMQAISMRFQNIRRAGHDPLAELKISFLRPLNNLMWGYIQDEQHRLTARRRAYEYAHEYGLRLSGAVASLQPVENRTRFPAAFEKLLHRAAAFYAHSDDAPATADALPLLNAIRDVHLLLSEGAHNQFGDLPWTARQEMLMEQWLLARPEFGEFLPSSAAFPEPWMSRVEAMRRLQGWGETSIQHYRDLATYGEQVLLSIRYGNWTEVIDPDQAANWAHFWRHEVEGYIRAYEVVGGADV